MFTQEQLDRDFTYHTPTTVTAPKYASIREAEEAVHKWFDTLRARAASPRSVVKEPLTPLDCNTVNAVTRAFAEVLDAQAPDGADKAAAYRCIRLARNGANEFIMSHVLGFPLVTDSLRIAVDEIVKARWQACGAVALDGK